MPASAQEGYETILLVDDAPMILHVGKTLLQSLSEKVRNIIDASD